MTQWKKGPEGAIELKDDCTDIWLSYLNVHEARLKHIYPALSDKEKERSEKFKFFKHRKLFIASHGFMRSVLSKYLGMEANEINYIEKENGKPILDEETFSRTRIHFNLSHSGNMAILAVSKNNDVGIDIEHLDRKNEWQKIIKRFFTPPEQEAIFKLPETQQQKAFFQTWTRKEAYMKVLGHGLSLAPDKFTVTITPERPALISHDTDKFDAPDVVSFMDIEIPENFGAYSATFSQLNKIQDVNYFVFS